MAIAIRGTTPAATITTSNPISLTLTGTRQPQTGDLLVIIHGNDFYALSNMPTPTVGGSTSGVNAVSGGSADGGTNHGHIKVYTYAVGSTGDLTVSVTETGSADEDKCLAVYVLSGADTATPTDGAAGNFNTSSTTTHNAPSVSPTSSDAYLICHDNSGGGSSASSYTPPTGMTEQYDSQVGGISHTGATLQLSASGATGTKTFTPSGSVEYATVTVAIKTAAGGSTVNGTATLTGAGTMSALATQGATSALTGAGILAAPVTERPTAALTGAGALTGNVTQGATGGPTGAGTLAALVTESVTAALVGAGAVSASSGATTNGTATLTGAGALAAAVTQAVTAAPAGVGAVAARATQAATLAAAGIGSLTAAVVESATATFAGAGALTASGGGAAHNATSAPAVTAGRSATATVAAIATSTPAVAGVASSTPTVSDG